MESVGHGAGEFTRVQQPSMQGFTKMSQYAPAWQLVENGPVRTVLETAHPWQHCTVRQRLVVYNYLKRLDFEIEILAFDGTLAGIRVAFPMKNDMQQEKCGLRSANGSGGGGEN